MRRWGELAGKARTEVTCGDKMAAEWRDVLSQRHDHPVSPEPNMQLTLSPFHHDCDKMSLPLKRSASYSSNPPLQFFDIRWVRPVWP